MKICLSVELDVPEENIDGDEIWWKEWCVTIEVIWVASLNIDMMSYGAPEHFYDNNVILDKTFIAKISFHS